MAEGQIKRSRYYMRVTILYIYKCVISVHLTQTIDFADQRVFPRVHYNIILPTHS